MAGFLRGASGAAEEIAEEASAVTAAGEGLSSAVRSTFAGGQAERIVLQEDLLVSRVFDKIPGVTGGGSEIGGRFFTTTPIASSAEAQNVLSLAGFNQAQFIESAIIPKGSVVFRGTAASVGNLPGGGVQIFVPNISQIQFFGIRRLR